MRALFILLCIILASVCTYFGVPLMQGNEKEISGIFVTIYTVFAGFLVAVITILGDPALLPESWRGAENQRENIENKLIRYRWLFFLYLSIIGLIFLSNLLNDAPNDKQVEEWLKALVEYVYFFLCMLAFFVSLALPAMLGSFQMERVDAKIKQLRTNAGIKDKP